MVEDAVVPPGSMALGVPARVRPLTGGEQQEWIEFGVRSYVESAKHYRTGLRRLPS